ncbi:s-phase kinase-associated protein 1 [Xylaria sp. FL0064]|nr:s-phase kinase-associated protein 1 [Xylaria sp. FL0064]
MSTTSVPMVTMASSDGVQVQASLLAVKKSVIIKTMLEDLGEERTADRPIPIPAVDGETLRKIAEWCEHYATSGPGGGRGRGFQDSTDLTQWDRDFLVIRDELLLKLSKAANYLEIPDLLDCTVLMIAMKLERMSTEEMREVLNISSDYSQEEEDALRATHAWAFQD